MGAVKSNMLVRRGAGGGRRGFTITEILVVIGIIVLIAALAVPAVNVLSGSRSIDGATNVVSSMLGRARAEALAQQAPVGVAVFEDADRGKVGLALVAGPQAWADGVSYQKGDFVYREVNSERWYFLCLRTHVSRQAAGTSDVDQPPVPTGGSGDSSDSWWPLTKADAPAATPAGGAPARRYPISKYLSILPGTDVIYLPPGIGAQVLNSSRTGVTISPQSDRYLHSSVIFFDADGRLAVNQQFGIMCDVEDVRQPNRLDQWNTSRLGMAIRFNIAGSGPGASQEVTGTNCSTNIDPGFNSSGSLFSNFGSPLTSGLGVVLYDRQAYLGHSDFPKWDYQLLMRSGSQYSAASGSEDQAESWLDQNGTLLLVNRYNGTLLKTE